MERYICQNPGASFNLIKSAFRMNPGTLRYHLEILERMERIRKVKKGTMNRYFPDYLARFRNLGSGKKNLKNDHRRVHNLIEENPGITRREILTSLDIGRDDLSSALKDLRDRKMIMEIKGSKDHGYEVLNERRIAGEIIGILVNKVLDEEMDMETFRTIKERVERELIDD